MAEEGLTPEQLIEQFRQMKVSDLLLSTLFTLSQLAYGKLEPSARDLDQARIAIDAMRALMPVVEPALPEEVRRDFGQVIANLQLAYASAASEPATSEPRGQTPGPGQEGQEPTQESAPAAPSPDADTSPEADTRGQTPGPGSESRVAAEGAAAEGATAEPGPPADEEAGGGS
jgi:hypothetical protein